MKTINIKRKKSYHHGDLRQSLVDAALKMLERNEDGQLSLSAVARKTGVSPQAAYNHFRDKGQLLAAAATQSLHAFTEVMNDAAQNEDPVAALQAIGVAYVLYATEHPSQFRLWRAPELVDRTHFPELQQALAGTFAVLVRCLDACAEEKLIRRSPTLATVAWSMVHGLASLCVDGQLAESGIKGSPRKLAEQAVNDLFEGLR